MNLELLKEESNQTIFLRFNEKWNKCKFMWFYNGKIEVMIDGRLISIPKRDWDSLSLSGIEKKSIFLN